MVRCVLIACALIQRYFYMRWRSGNDVCVSTLLQRLLSLRSPTAIVRAGVATCRPVSVACRAVVDHRSCALAALRITLVRTFLQTPRHNAPDHPSQAPSLCRPMLALAARVAERCSRIPVRSVITTDLPWLYTCHSVSRKAADCHACHPYAATAPSCAVGQGQEGDTWKASQKKHIAVDVSKIRILNQSYERKYV